eukprot:1184257-Prorocentrum_minimum.AAC.3
MVGWEDFYPLIGGMGGLLPLDRWWDGRTSNGAHTDWQVGFSWLGLAGLNMGLAGFSMELDL